MGIGAFVTVGVLALFVVRSQTDPVVEGIDAEPDREVQLELLRRSANADAGDGARAKRESGRVGKRDARVQRAKGNTVAVKKPEIDRQLAENAGTLRALRDAGDLDGMFGSNGLDAGHGGVGGLIGARGTQIGSGGLAPRGSGLGGGGTAQGLGGLGTKGIGSGRSGYGSGGGSFGARGVGGRVGFPSQAALRTHSERTQPLSQDWTDHGHNPTELVEQDLLSTFSIDVDTASYTQGRAMLQGQQLPVPSSVRTEEYVNFFRYDYPEPEAGRPFSITMDGAEHPWRSGHHLLRVGIKGAEQHERTRRPVHLTFLVDVSGSMYHPQKLPLVKQSLEHLVGGLHEGDTVALVTYAGATRIALPTMDATNKAEILHAIRSLSTGGGTAMGSGMDLAYELAASTRREGEESRVIVLSDGDANIGGSSHEAILGRIRQWAGKGITLSAVGFGRGNYRDTLMEQLADKGDGNYSYVDSFDEAERVFGEDLGATLRTIARDVKIQVAFDPDSVIAYKLVGYENRAIADQDFRNDAVDAGEVGAGHTVTALYDLVLRDRPGPSLAEVRVRHKEPGPDVPAVETAVDLPSRAVDIAFEAGSRDLRRAFAAASFAEKLRLADELSEVSWDQIVTVVDQSARPGDDRDQELKTLVRTARSLAQTRQAQVAQGDRGPDDGLLHAGDPIILGALDRGLIDQVLARHANQVAYCYKRELTKDPSLAGKLAIKFVVDRDGSVSSASVKSSTLASDAVGSCVAGRFLRMQFPAPTGGGIVIATYPLLFSPA